MEERSSNLLNEIQQLIEQYKAEVPGGRKAWPESIKQRAMELRTTGMSFHEMSKQTGIAYHTLLSWRGRLPRETAHQRFRELAVTNQPQINVIPATLTTVTVGKKRKYTKAQTAITVTVGKGIVVSGLDLRGAIEIIKQVGVYSGDSI